MTKTQFFYIKVAKKRKYLCKIDLKLTDSKNKAVDADKLSYFYDEESGCVVVATNGNQPNEKYILHVTVGSSTAKLSIQTTGVKPSMSVLFAFTSTTISSVISS